MRAIVVSKPIPISKKYVIKQVIIIIALLVLMFIISQLVNKNKIISYYILTPKGSTLARIENVYIGGKINGVIEVNKVNNKVSYNEEYTKKGSTRYFVIRDSKTKDILAIYKPCFNRENISKDVTYSILDKAPRELTEITYTNIKAEDYYDINKTIKEYNSKYKKSVLSYESGIIYPDVGIICLCAFMLCSVVFSIKTVKLIGYLFLRF